MSVQGYVGFLADGMSFKPAGAPPAGAPDEYELEEALSIWAVESAVDFDSVDFANMHIRSLRASGFFDSAMCWFAHYRKLGLPVQLFTMGGVL